jgi:hypothetical protein
MPARIHLHLLSTAHIQLRESIEYELVFTGTRVLRARDIGEERTADECVDVQVVRERNGG